MEVTSFKLISQNIASSKRVERIQDIVKSECPDLLFLQEVTLKTAELKAALQGTMYSGQCNIDIANPSSPGTATVWRTDLPTPQVTDLVTCQLQAVQIGLQTFLNVYAPSGSLNRRARASLFHQDMFPYLLQNQQGLLPVLSGDWNCLLSARDTTANFREKFSKELDQIIKVFKYSDSFCKVHPLKEDFTFY